MPAKKLLSQSGNTVLNPVYAQGKNAFNPSQEAVTLVNRTLDNLDNAQVLAIKQVVDDYKQDKNIVDPKVGIHIPLAYIAGETQYDKKRFGEDMKSGDGFKFNWDKILNKYIKNPQYNPRAEGSAGAYQFITANQIDPKLTENNLYPHDNLANQTRNVLNLDAKNRYSIRNRFGNLSTSEENIMLGRAYNSGKVQSLSKIKIEDKKQYGERYNDMNLYLKHKFDSEVYK